ncbi:MAG: NIPSNAP family protein [Planctomycetes bacterium]|nr:NIPSNAP family protein [Planctomycetota bacterium]
MIRTLVGSLICLVALAASARAADSAGDRYFEMRTYITHDGRMDALLARFRDHTNAIFVKHGITPIGYWVPTEGENAENTLVYIVAYPSREAREASWKAFRADPAWLAAKEASERDGKIVKKVEEKFLKPTDFSGIK